MNKEFQILFTIIYIWIPLTWYDRINVILLASSFSKAGDKSLFPQLCTLTFSHRTQKLISVCFVYTRYEQCILISVANEHYYRIMNLNNLDLLLVHFLRNWLWKHQATRCGQMVLYFCIHVSLNAKRSAINMVICRFNATNASPSTYRRQYLGLTICGRFFFYPKIDNSFFWW